MTSPRTIAAGLALSALLAAGCDVGQPSGFTARSNFYCRQTSTQIDKLTRPVTLEAQLQFATDRYTLVERLVSELTDSSLPDSSTGSQLRVLWLQPARVSLRDGYRLLVELRDAVNTGNRAAASTAFDRSLAVGTNAVDTTLLHNQGLDDCAQVFAPTGHSGVER